MSIRDLRKQYREEIGNPDGDTACGLLCLVVFLATVTLLLEGLS